MTNGVRCIATAWPQYFWTGGLIGGPNYAKYDPRLDITEAPLMGPHTFDVTDQVLALGEKAAKAIRDNDPSSEALWRQWCLDNVAGVLYRGVPARVSVQAAIEAFFKAGGGR